MGYADARIEVGDLVGHLLMDETWGGIVTQVHDFYFNGETVTKALVYLTSSHRFSKWHNLIKTPRNLPTKMGWVDVDFLCRVSGGKNEEQV